MRLRYLVLATWTVLLFTGPVAVAHGDDGHGGGKPALGPCIASTPRLAASCSASGGRRRSPTRLRTTRSQAAIRSVWSSESTGECCRAASVPTHTCTMRAGTDLRSGQQRGVLERSAGALLRPDRGGAAGLRERLRVRRRLRVSDQALLDGGPIWTSTGTATRWSRDNSRPSSHRARSSTRHRPGDVRRRGVGGDAATRARPGRHVVDGEVVLPDGTSVRFGFIVEVLKRRN